MPERDAVGERNDDAVGERNDDAVGERNDDAVRQRNDDAVGERNDDAVGERNDDAVTPYAHFQVNDRSAALSRCGCFGGLMADSAWSQAEEELGRALRMTGPWLPNFLSWVSLLKEAGVVRTEESLIWHEDARECLRAIHAIAAGGQVAVTIPDQGGRWFERLESSLPVAPGSAVAMEPPELASVECLVHLLSVCDRPVGPVVAKLLAAGRLICSAQRLSDEGVAAPFKAGQMHLAALFLIQDVLRDQADRSWKLFESLPVPAWSRVGPMEALQRRARLAGSASRVVLHALEVEESAVVRGGQAVEAHAAILDAIGDVRSVFAGNVLVGPHLLTQEYGVRAGPEGMQALTEAKPRERRELLYRSGALEAVAEFVEGQRKAFHAAIAGLGSGSSAARDWVHAVDALASTLYPPPALEATRFLLSPDGVWHERVRGACRRMGAAIGAEGLPEIPRFVPWGAPQWMYDDRSKVVFYPDLECEGDSLLQFQAELLAVDLAAARGRIEGALPLLVAHETFHAMRDLTGSVSKDFWYEEWVANRLAVAWVRSHEPAALEVARETAVRILSVQGQATEMGLRRLAAVGNSEYRPVDSGYGDVGIHEMVRMQAEMMVRLTGLALSYPEERARYLKIPS